MGNANDEYELQPTGVVPPAISGGALREQLARERGGDVSQAGAGASPAGHSGETGNALEADVDHSDDGELKGEALDERAAELDIEGRSTMSADQKRKAIAKAEKS